MYLHAIHLTKAKRFLWFLQLMGEALGYFLLLRWSYLRSFGLFINSYSKVKNSRKNMIAVANGSGLLSVNGVVDIIRDSLKGHQVVRF